ncbi:MAG: plasmid mobilization protein [Sphingobacteriales bacterium]
MPERKNRTRKIVVRFNEDEFKQVEEMEKTLGLNKSELIRARVLENSKGLVVNSKTLIAELAIVGAEMNRHGNNINQLARHANTLKLQGLLEPVIVENFNLLLARHLKNQEKLEVVLRQVIRKLIH